LKKRVCEQKTITRGGVEYNAVVCVCVFVRVRVLSHDDALLGFEARAEVAGDGLVEAGGLGHCDGSTMRGGGG